MLHIGFNLFNPWTRQTQYKEVWQRHWLLKEKGHKHIDIGVYRHIGLILDFGVSWTHRQDHAGIAISLGLLGFYTDVHFYDDRHWNPVERKWESHD
jgi:hypothetical protein